MRSIMKKSIHIIAILLASISLLFLVACEDIEIGKIQGAEWEVIVIDSTEYVKTTSSDISIADKGAYLGKVTDGDKVTFRVYSVKNDTEGKYIYCVWDWEGSIYEKK